MTTRQTHTDAGEPLGDLLRALFEAMPAPATQKLSKPWERLLAFYHQPTYRFLANGPDGSAVLTRCDDGATVTRTGEAADRFRDVFEMTDSGAPVTAQGVGVCGAHKPLAEELFETEEKADPSRLLVEGAPVTIVLERGAEIVVIGHTRTIADAENFLSLSATIDPDDLAAGRYGIDAPHGAGHDVEALVMARSLGWKGADADAPAALVYLSTIEP